MKGRYQLVALNNEAVTTKYHIYRRMALYILETHDPLYAKILHFLCFVDLPLSIILVNNQLNAQNLIL